MHLVFFAERLLLGQSEYARALCAAYQQRLQQTAYWVLGDSKAAQLLTMMAIVRVLRVLYFQTPKQPVSTLAPLVYTTFVDLLLPQIKSPKQRCCCEPAPGVVDDSFQAGEWQAALRTLNPLRRLVYILYEVHQTPLLQISQWLGLDLAVCQRHLGCARMQLRNELITLSSEPISTPLAQAA